MKVVRVDWHPDDARFTVSGGHAGQAITVNAPHEGPATGFSASELLLAGVGACSAWDVVEILRKSREQVDSLEVTVQGEQDPDPPWPFGRIEVRYVVGGRGLDREAVDRAVRLSTEKYCSVIATIRGIASVETVVEVVDLPDIREEEAARIIR